MPLTRNYSAGSIVYFAGDMGEDIYVLQKGRISLISTSLDQKDDIKEDVRKGEFFGVKSALGRYPREETAQVLSDSQVLVFKLAEFEQFAQKNTRIVLQMLKVFSSQLRRVHKAVREFLGEHGAAEASMELVRVGEYYYKAGKTDYALYAFNAYLRNYPTGSLTERVRRLAQQVKEGAPFPIDLPDISEEMHNNEVAQRTGQMARQMHDDSGGYTAMHEHDAITPELPDMGDVHGDLPDLPVPAGDFDLPMPDDFDTAPAKTPAQQFNDGLSAFAAQRFDEALAAYEEALALGGASDPALHEKLLYELGRTYVKKNNAKGAVEKFSELLRTYAHGTLARKAVIQLAEIYERAKDVARAASLYEKAAHMPPQDKEANLALQKANQLRGRK
ncbi:MAG: cyclic nucleotide-binding domain-containing protein [Turneriella sp.]